MRQFDKPKSSRQTLEELKAQIENARPVVVDKSGRLYAPDLMQQPAPPPPSPYQQGYAQPGQPPYAAQSQGYQRGPQGYPAQPQPQQHQYDAPLPQGLRVKPSRWF